MGADGGRVPNEFAAGPSAQNCVQATFPYLNVNPPPLPLPLPLPFHLNVYLGILMVYNAASMLQPGCALAGRTVLAGWHDQATRFHAHPAPNARGIGGGGGYLLAGGGGAGVPDLGHGGVPEQREQSSQEPRIGPIRSASRKHGHQAEDITASHGGCGVAWYGIKRDT